MDPVFTRRDGRLYCEGVDLAAVAARYGTPCYVYSRAALSRRFDAFATAFGARPHRVCYAVKANANLAVLDLLARRGAGFDIVSAGELERVRAAGGDPATVVFSGVGKQRWEIERALDAGIFCFNVESQFELEAIEAVAAARGRRAPIALRVNPDVEADTHRHIRTGAADNKFGIPIDTAEALYARAAASPHLRVAGVACHIGSQLTRVEPVLAAARRVLELVDALAARGIELEHIDLGGGLGIRYRDETPPEPETWVAALCEALAGRPQTLLIEPGRAIAGPAGVLLARVIGVKDQPARRFAVVDAAMNDLLRPALYEAWQDIVPLGPPRPAERDCDIVGPVCESADCLGRARRLALEAGDLVAVCDAGAYGFSMASNYNARPRPAEVLIDGDRMHLVREREPLAALWALERRLPES